MKRLLHRPRADAIPGNEIYRILVCRPNHRLGNMILVTPLIAELERLYQGAEIDIVAEGNAAVDVFQTFSSVRHIYCLSRRGFKHPFVFLSKILRIRRTDYDLIIDPCLGSGFSRLLARLFKGRRKLGFDDGARRSRGMTHLVPASMAPHHMAKRSVMLVRWYASHQINEAEDFPALDLRLTAAEKQHGEQLIRRLVVASDQPCEGGVIGLFAEATGKSAIVRRGGTILSRPFGWRFRNAAWLKSFPRMAARCWIQNGPATTPPAFVGWRRRWPAST